MAVTDIPSSGVLRKLLRYDTGTGKLFWLPRPLNIFPDARSGKIWNTRYAGAEAFTRSDRLGYRHGAVFNVPMLAHRVIWKLMTGEDADEIDHINGDPSDNRMDNLRSVSRAVNSRNACRSARNKSGVTGVWWYERDQKWQTQITLDGKRINIGVFDEFDAAVAARRKAEIQYGFHENHGRIARSD